MPPSRTSTFNIQESNTSQSAALAGAALAFRKPNPKAGAKGHTGANGALAAATSASPSPKQRSPAPPLKPDLTGGSVRSVRSSASKDVPGAMPTLQLPVQPTQSGHVKSPSHQAASLAAARSPTPAMRPNPGDENVRAGARTTQRFAPAAPPKPKRFSGHSSKVEAENSDKPTDATPIAPTTSLVDLFERKGASPPSSRNKPEPVVIKPSQDLAMRSPKPVRPSRGITSMFQMEMEGSESRPKPRGVDPGRQTADRLQTDRKHSSSDSYASASEDMTAPSAPEALRRRDSENAMPPPPAPRRSGFSPLPPRKPTTEAIDIQQPPYRSLTSPSETFSPPSLPSVKSIPAQYNQLYPRKVTPNMTGDQLANAMVAGSLASSRASSPQRLQPPPLPPSRQQKQGHTPLSFSRTPSPAKPGLKKTLRQIESDSSDEEDDDKLHPYSKHKKKRLVRKHPNKHHEGDRKRWREAVTERERKRYEGVWAANKNLLPTTGPILRHSSPSSQHTIQDGANHVSSIVVHDLWQRSRLPDTVLEVVWDLVDDEGAGRLTREEFVVGLWLIDQRLKGRKLPVKVSETVWASVRALQGIKIRK